MKFTEFAAIAPKSTVKSLVARVAERQNDLGMPLDPDSALLLSEIIPDGNSYEARVYIACDYQESLRYVPKYRGWV